MNYINITEVCDIQIGRTPKRSESKYWGKGNTWVSIADMNDKYIAESTEEVNELAVKECNMKSIPENTVIMSFKLSIGKVAITKKELFTNEAIAAFLIKDNNLLLTEYLYYVLKNYNFDHLMDRAAKGKTLNKRKLEQIEIPLISIEKQQQIINVLNKTETILQNRHQQIEALSALKQSIFLYIFKGNKKYSNVKLRDVITSITAGLSTGGENRKKEEGELGVLTTSAVTYGVFDPKAFKVPPEDKLKDKKLVFPTKYSILVSRMNTKELVGAACIVEEDYTELFLPDRLWKLVPNTELINPYYLISVIQSRLFRTQIDRISTGTSGSMQNISQKNYLDLEIPLIDLESQNKYASKISAINHKMKMINSSLENIKMLYEVLLHKSFNGELFKEEGLEVV